MAYTQILYHIVFRTKRSERTIVCAIKRDLFACIWNIIQEQQSVLYRIGGVEDHIHILTSICPTVALSDFMKKVKGVSSHWMRQQKVYWDGWGEGYCALTYNYSEKEKIINYINNQEDHHKRYSWLEEIKNLLKENGLEVDDRFL